MSLSSGSSTREVDDEAIGVSEGGSIGISPKGLSTRIAAPLNRMLMTNCTCP